MGLPVLAMFLVWLGYGVWQWRRSDRILERMSAIDRTRKPLLGIVYLFGGAAFLLAALYGVYAAGGFAEKGVEPWAWPVCALAGLAFVHAQVTAGALLMSMAVTMSPSKPSEQEKEES